MENKEEYVLMMPVVQQEETGETMFFPSSAMSGAIQSVPVTYEALSGFAKSFTGFEMDTIEIHVKGVAKSGGFTQLIVGLEGEAGVKLTLKKKEE
ncbi:hypothetical protein [Paenibacillus sp. IHBB 3054]|uniref:hypothetical protein n=1 Tax=Paenibacillus sp. IHBB 3054 TaxID=3425689 RepID=UPI003F66258A